MMNSLMHDTRWGSETMVAEAEPIAVSDVLHGKSELAKSPPRGSGKSAERGGNRHRWSRSPAPPHEGR